jgi:hypothetical protein
VKTKDAGKSKGWSKQKKQFVVLGGLSVVLVGVMVVQFRGGDNEYQVAALSQDAVSAAAEPAASEAAPPAAPVAKDNAVLSQVPAEAELARNPFTNFWSRDTNSGDTAAIVPPPAVVLGMTIPGGNRPVAVIDGQLHFVGDLVQGWTLEAVHARSIVLRSPAQEQLVVEMPLFHRTLLPELATVPAAPR